MHDLAGEVEHGGVVVQDEVGVGGQHDAVQLEGQPVRVLTCRQFVPGQSGRREAADQVAELGLKRCDQVFDRPRAGVHLQGRVGDETPSGERVALQVLEERLAHPGQLAETGRSRQRRLDDLRIEDPGCLGHGRQLEFLLGTEVRVQAALAHAERSGQVTDGQRVQPVDSGQRRGGAQDRVAGPLPVGPRRGRSAAVLRPCSAHCHRNLARPAVRAMTRRSGQSVSVHCDGS